MIGQTISNYKILEKLGEGGMGVVYKGLDTKLNRHVAIKLLSSQLSASEGARQRFVREARTVSSLEHPNICTIHEINETPDGRIFIVMPCYEGKSLDRVAKGSLKLGEAIDIVAQVAAGLAKAHQQGITHRDIKPGNIIITEDNLAKIVDFGLAKLTGQTKLTKTDGLVGTAAYMSPEQVRGEDVDAQSDVFSLGIVLYELITGHLPFEGDHVAAVLYSIVNKEPEPLAVHHQNLPADLQHIIDKILQKDKHQRYKNASDFKTDLELIKDELKTPSSPKVESVGQSGRVSEGISPLRAAALTAVVVAVGIIAFFGWFFPRHDGDSLKPEGTSLAVLDFTQLETSDDQIPSASVMALLQVGLVQHSHCRVVSPEYLLELRRRLFSTAEGSIGADEALEIARESGARVLLSGQLATLDKAPHILWRLVDTENGESLGAGRDSGNSLAALVDKVIANVLFQLEAFCGTEKPAILKSVTAFTTESPEAYRHYILGKTARDEYRIVDAVQELERAIELDSTFALAYLEMSMAHYSGRSGGFNKDEAKRFAKKAWDLRDRLAIKDRLRIESRQYQMNGRLEDALNTYRTMLSRWPNDHEAIIEFSELLVFYSRFDEAGSVIERGMEFFPNDELLSGSYGDILFLSNQPRKALEARRAHLEKFPNNPNEWDNLGRVYLQLGMPDSADTAFREALRIDSEFLWGQVGFGYSAYCRSDPAGAIEIIKNTLGKANLLPRERIWLQFLGAFPLSYLYLDAGRHQDALDLFESALTDFQGHSLEIRIKIAQSLVHLHLGRIQDAELLLKNQVNKSALKAWEPYIRTELSLKLDSLDTARQLAEEYAAIAKTDLQYTTWSIMLARIELADEQPQKALDLLDKLNERYHFQLGFKDIELREIRASALQKTGRLQESSTELIELLRIYGGHTIARYELGQIFEEMGRSSEAVNEYEKFLDMWAQADEGMSQLESARRRLAAIKDR